MSSICSDDCDAHTITASFVERSDVHSLLDHDDLCYDRIGSKMEYTQEGNPQFPLFDNLSKLSSVFSYDEAKGLLDKHLAQKNIKSSLVSFLHVMISVIASEKQYMNGSYLIPKGFLRKECTLKRTLEQIRSDLNKFNGSDLTTFAAEIMFIVNIRLDQMDFYEKLSLLGSAKNVEVDDLISDYEGILEKYSQRKKETCRLLLGFPHIFTSIGWEVEAVSHLLKAHSAMQSWDFFSSVIASQEAQKRLSEWGDFLQLFQNTKKSSFLNSGIVNPAMYCWITKLKCLLLSKFSLYFYEILSRYSNSKFDIKMVSPKLQADYVSKIGSFVKKSDALTVCLVLDSRGITFYPNGYSFPARPQQMPTGINSFPVVLGIPVKPTTSSWPGVVMLINDRFKELDTEKCVGFFDSQIQTTYFIQKVDSRMYMVAIYESKKSEKDSYIVRFMQEIAGDIKCGKMFHALKAISK